jgi:hypothetical protein
MTLSGQQHKVIGPFRKESPNYPFLSETQVSYMASVLQYGDHIEPDGKL